MNCQHRQLGATGVGLLNPLKVLRGDVEGVPSSATVTEKISA